MSIVVLQSSRWGRMREKVALLSLSFWCLVMVVLLFLAVPWVCLGFVIVVFPDHTHLLFSSTICIINALIVRYYAMNLFVVRFL